MGFSIGKVFRPIEEEMRKYAEVNSLYMPEFGYGLKSLVKNIKCVRKAVASEKYDIVHITGTEHYLIPFLRKGNVVITIHDLGFFTNKKLSLSSISKYFIWIKTLPLAKRVTFISESSKQEAEKYVKFTNGQASVIPDPFDKAYEYSPKKINGDCPRVLHIGSKPNKNLNNTILALEGMNCHFRIVAKISDSQKEQLDLLKIDYSVVCNISDDEMLQEYKDCDIVSFPSLYEGFGMPIIEGQSIGRPVVTSNIEPMKSIAGGAAVLVEPSDYKSIRKGYEEAIKILNPI